MPRPLDTAKLPAPLTPEVVKDFLTIGVPYRLKMLDFAAEVLPMAKSTRESAYIEVGIVTGRLLLEFLGVGSKGDVNPKLVENRSHQTRKGETDDVKITDLGGAFVELDALNDEEKDTLAKFHRGASKASAHFTWDSGHQLDPATLGSALALIGDLVRSHLPKQ